MEPEIHIANMKMTVVISFCIHALIYSFTYSITQRFPLIYLFIYLLGKQFTSDIMDQINKLSNFLFTTSDGFGKLNENLGNNIYLAQAIYIFFI